MTMMIIIFIIIIIIIIIILMIYLDYRSPGFTGVHRLHPRKIVLMILFGFEVKKVPNKIIFLICFESNLSPGGQP